MSQFKKSSKCEAATCVEVSFDHTPGMVVVKDDAHDQVRYTHFEWIEFVEAVKRGEFDYPA